METQTATAVQDEKIKFTTPEQAEKYEAMMGRNFVKLGTDKKPDKDAKDFVYRIIGMHPKYQGGRAYRMDEFIMQFEVQKYFKNKFISKSVPGNRDGQTVKDNLPVHKWEMAGNGGWDVADEEGNFFMDAEVFLGKFAPEQ